MHNSQPKDYSHRCLLLVSGMSPQIVTETLYALTQTRKPGFVPTEVHLITTQRGAEQARLNLLSGPGHFIRFCKAYGLDNRIFSRHRIHVIQDAEGRELNDIRTPNENEVAADFITSRILDLTASPETALHVSVAGGRKTMGYYAGYALSLFGRPQDSLSHVLVSEHYESNKDFFYPTPTTHVIFDRDNNPLDASKAQVWLAKIPFVRLRSGLPESLLGGQHGFSETVALARKVTEKARLVLFPSDRVYELNAVSGKLTPVLMAIILWP